MKQVMLTAALFLSPMTAQAQPMIDGILEAHILPRFEALADTSQALATAASADCRSESETLRSAYGMAFDAWVSASHLRFGPTEVNDRAFALAFWPDSRGATPRVLASLIADADPIAASADRYDEVSIAARGFYALEFLLYDEALSDAGDPDYRCTLIQTISTDIATTSAAILNDWETSYVDEVSNPGPHAIYRTEEEVLQEMFKALGTGLQFTSDTRLGRPLGTFDRPRPARAEARRSGRSASHILLSLASLRDLATHLASGNAALAERLETQFTSASGQLAALNDPVFAGVAAPQTRLKVEIIQQAVDAIRETVTQELGPTLGVAAGFNSLDGD